MTNNVAKPKASKRRRNRRAMPAGMVLRGRVYHADFMKNGRRFRKRLSTDFDSASEMLNELRGRADRGELEILDNRYPWADIKKDFLAWAKQHIRDWEAYERDLKHFEEFSPVRCVSLVTPRLVDQFRQKRLAEGVTPRTVNREVGTIRNMLNKAVRRFKVIASNPLAEVRRLPEGDPTKVRRSLSAEEVGAIFQNCPADLKPVLRLYATTGMRKRELINLLFDDVDWENHSLTVRASVAKAKKAREIPLDDETMGMLIELRDAADSRPDGWDRDHVFVNRLGNPLRNNLLDRFYVVCKRAGIDDAEPCGSVDLHALRVTFVTLALDGGANPKAVQTILGHSTLDMTMRVYAKATNRAMREAVNALPFATVSPPKHVVTIDAPNDKRQNLSQDSHKCSAHNSAKAS